MDGMQRFREIKANADPDDPMTKLRLSLIVACDIALAEAIELERQGKPGKVRALGFTATADLLEEPFADADVEVAADAIARAWGYSDLVEADSVRGEGEGVRAAARAVLDALARTGRHRGKTTTVPR